MHAKVEKIFDELLFGNSSNQGWLNQFYFKT